MSKSVKNAPLGASLIVVSSIFYASYGIWTKLMGDAFGGFAAAALRCILVLLILAAAATIYHRLEPLKVQQNWKYFAGMVIAAGFVWGPLYYAIQTAGVGVSLSLNYASFVIGMFVFGWLLARERFTKDKAVAGGIGLLGVWLVFAPSIAHSGWLALAASLLSGFSSAAVYVIAKKINYRSTQSTMAVWAASLISNGIIALVIHDRLPPIGIHPAWGYLVLFSISSVIASWLAIKGMKVIEAGAAGILGLLEIVFGVLFGIVLFSERPPAIVLAGVALIIVAAAVPYINEMRLTTGKVKQA
jgi:drug/metabolite transporter (DMT)-like permease